MLCFEELAVHYDSRVSVRIGRCKEMYDALLIATGRGPVVDPICEGRFEREGG